PAPGLGTGCRARRAAANRRAVPLRAPPADELHAAVPLGPAGDVADAGAAERRADRVHPVGAAAGGARPAAAVRRRLRSLPKSRARPDPVAGAFPSPDGGVMRPFAEVRAVFFDAVGTLIHPEPPAGAVYAEVGRRHGSRLTAAEIARRFAAAFRR